MSATAGEKKTAAHGETIGGTEREAGVTQRELEDSRRRWQD